MEAELGRDHDSVAPASERAGQQLLVGVGTIRFGRIEERHAQLDGAVNGGDGLAVVAFLGRAIGEAHPHAAEPDRRHLQTAASQLGFLHGFPSLRAAAKNFVAWDLPRRVLHSARCRPAQRVCSTLLAEILASCGESLSASRYSAMARSGWRSFS